MSKRSSHGKSWRLRFQAEITNMQRCCDGKELKVGVAWEEGVSAVGEEVGEVQGVRCYRLCRGPCNSFLKYFP